MKDYTKEQKKLVREYIISQNPNKENIRVCWIYSYYRNTNNITDIVIFFNYDPVGRKEGKMKSDSIIIPLHIIKNECKCLSCEREEKLEKLFS